MDSFKLFLESDLNALVGAIVSQRFDRTARLIAADWLDENESPALAKFVRYVNDVSTKEIKYNYSQFEKIQEAALNEVFETNVQILFGNGNIPEISQDGKLYRLGVDSVQKLTKNQWEKVKDISKLPEGVIKGLILAISHENFHAIEKDSPSDLDEPREVFFKNFRNLMSFFRVLRQRFPDVRTNLELAVIKRLEYSVNEFVKSLTHVDSEFLKTAKLDFNRRTYFDEFMIMYNDLIERQRRREMIAARKPWEKLRKSLDQALEIFNSKLRS